MTDDEIPDADGVTVTKRYAYRILGAMAAPAGWWAIEPDGTHHPVAAWGTINRGSFWMFSDGSATPTEWNQDGNEHHSLDVVGLVPTDTLAVEPIDCADATYGYDPFYRAPGDEQ